MSTTFIGVDLAWNANGANTGVAVLRGDARCARFISVSSGVDSLSGVTALITEHSNADTVVAVDASLIVRNRVGQRPCETEVGRRFWQYYACCHSTNLSKPHARTGMRLVKQLGEAGFVHDLDLAQARHRRGRWLLEVYPHPAMVRLFGLTRIIQYKKGSVTKRRTALQELQRLVGTLRRAQPRLEDTKELHDFLTRDLESLRGQSLKQYEDSLDALFCAYLAYHCWCWGSERNEMIGDLDTGYIVVPT